MLFQKFSSSLAFKTFLLTILLWILVVIYVIFYSAGLDYKTGSSNCQALVETVKTLRQRLDEDSEKMEEVLEQINKQREIRMENKDIKPVGTPLTIGLGHEILRRRAVHYTHELWYSISADLRELTKELDPNTNTGRIQSLHNRIDELTRYLLVNLDGLGRVNQLAKIRRDGLDRLARLVQRRIRMVQNPRDCSKAKFLLVSLDRPCAFGCNVHHLSYCFQLAYATNRTLVFSSDHSSYTQWWNSSFEPLSSKCPGPQSSRHFQSPEFTNVNQVDSPRVVRCAYIAMAERNLPWLPPAVPQDIAPELHQYHGAPFVWFIGQLITYLMRPSRAFGETMNKLFDQYQLTGPKRLPTVGIHVRRTDKINTEAAFHDLKEYMNYVDRYYEYLEAEQQMMARKEEWVDDVFSEHRLHTNPIKRRVFLATDEPSLFEEAARAYPKYEFVGDASRAETAAVVKRHEANSVTGIALDILALSRTDYLVCTFSSQVCRVAYELMQARHADLGDASDRVQSLDDVYYFGGQQASPFEAVIADQPSGIQPGDLVHMAGNHWNGYAKVTPVKLPDAVLAPAYKFQPRVLAVNMGKSLSPAYKFQPRVLAVNMGNHSVL
ncbi:Alpha 1 6 fucosyltransferase H [Fasciola gigantica]|uniref:Alpha 1 6 fucosyltransferase H n=1 Tax=Fasciola gigantica TaxID=46835 RepID=A0A504YZL0_FASGI|nr:Alpha 1 6 fucosyltransferase H [Fasciola gigantica]